MENVVHVWSRKIAEAVAPEEVELAPLIVEAFVEGGEKRTQLFRGPRDSAFGGFGTGDVQVLLPWVLKGLVAAVPSISAMLAVTPHISDFVSMIKDALEIRRDLKQEQPVQDLPDDPYAPLKRTVAVVSRELAATSLSAAERDLIVYRVLLALLDDPTGATHFIQAIDAGSNVQPA
jgi:hypothetical protein